MDERKLCEKCGKPITGRRSDARKCLECRRYDERESSKKIKDKEKEERILDKVERYGIRGDIEREKSRKILEGLKNEFIKNPKITKEDLLQNSFQFSPSEIAKALGFGLSSDWEKEIEERDLEFIKEFIDKKIEEKSEEVKEETRKELEEKRKKFGSTFDYSY